MDKPESAIAKRAVSPPPDKLPGAAAPLDCVAEPLAVPVEWLCSVEEPAVPDIVPEVTVEVTVAVPLTEEGGTVPVSPGGIEAMPVTLVRSEVTGVVTTDVTWVVLRVTEVSTEVETTTLVEAGDDQYLAITFISPWYCTY